MKKPGVGHVAVLVVLGAAATAGAAQLRWAAAAYTDELRGSVSVDATGSDLAPALVPLALAGLAALGAVLASRGVLRRLVGGLLVVLGVVVGWLGVHGLTTDPLDTLAPGESGRTAGIQPFGPTIAVVGGLLLVVGGVLVTLLRSAPRSMGSRYERGERGERAARRTPMEDPSFAMWKDLDADRDPTISNASADPQVDRIAAAPTDPTTGPADAPTRSAEPRTGSDG